MKNYKLRSVKTGKTLFEGAFLSFADCLEKAVLEQIDLSFADLRNTNLTHASLDGGILSYADFTDANLSGANLSECDLHGASFMNTSLYNACLCESDLTGCNFKGASFGATDINGSLLNRSIFSTLSCFTLCFSNAQALQGCLFIDVAGRASSISRPPIVINGLSPSPLVFTDRNILHGHDIITTEEAFMRLEAITNYQAHRKAV